MKKIAAPTSPHFNVQQALLGCALTLSLHAALPTLLAAQTTDRDLEAIASWVAVDAATGYERRVAPALASALGGWTPDAYGNVVTTVGTGSPHRIVACALDRPSYAVSQVRDDGYLRLHRIGSGSRHPLWDQQFEAQQVRVLTAAGPVAGVIARTNGHFAQQHAGETSVATADDLWLDVGAESRADVEALGIALAGSCLASASTVADRGRRGGPGRRAKRRVRGGRRGRCGCTTRRHPRSYDIRSECAGSDGMGRSLLVRGSRRACRPVDRYWRPEQIRGLTPNDRPKSSAASALCSRPPA